MCICLRLCLCNCSISWSTLNIGVDNCIPVASPWRWPVKWHKAGGTTTTTTTHTSWLHCPVETHTHTRTHTSEKILLCGEWEVVYLEATNCRDKTVWVSSVAIPTTAASAVGSRLHCNLHIWVRVFVCLCVCVCYSRRVPDDEHVRVSSNKWEGVCVQGRSGQVWRKAAAMQKPLLTR